MEEGSGLKYTLEVQSMKLVNLNEFEFPHL